MLTQDELELFLCQGWVLLPGFLDADLMELTAELGRVFPSNEQYWAEPDKFPQLRGGQFDSVRTIPTGIPRLDLLPFQERFRSIAEQLIGSADLRIMRGGYQEKFTDAADFEQILHLDYTNHTLVVLPGGDASTMVGFFAYFSEVTKDTGPTMVVSREHTRHVADTHLRKEEWADVYAHEEPLLCGPGTLLVYDYRTFHRGSALTGTRARRVTLSFAYGVAAPWHGFYSWPNRADEPDVGRLIALLSPGERALIGFPRPGDEYWTPETIEAVARRYPGFDSMPYLSAAGSPGQHR
jgi:hypothetical protein